MPSSSGRTGTRCSALLLRKTNYRDADLIVTAFTEELGVVSAYATGARKSQRRFGGALEPIHTLRLELAPSRTGDLLSLRSAKLELPRLRATTSLRALEAAGKALEWIRRGAPPSSPEPMLWHLITTFLDGINETPAEARRDLATFGMGLLEALGWGLDLERCVRCGKGCDRSQRAMADGARGGLICRACGGARLILEPAMRQRLRLAVQGQRLLIEDVEASLALVAAVLERHGGID